MATIASRVAALNPWSTPHYTFNRLFAMDKGQIFKLFESIATKPADFQIKAIYHPDLKTAFTAMQDIVSGGPETSKFFIDPKTNKLAPKELTFEGKAIPLYTCYDLLGWFMTVIGPAPKEATKETYLIPMVILFCKWSQILANGAKLPVMSSVIHVPSANRCLISADICDDLTPDLALGASLPGGRTKREHKTEAQQGRLQMLETHDFGVAKSEWPCENVTGKNDFQRFGHCAESIPLTMARILNGDLKGMFGVATPMEAACKAAGLELPPESLRNPCLNCEHLVKEMPGADVNNFKASPSGVKEYEGADEKAGAKGGETSQKPPASPNPSAPPPAPSQPPAPPKTPTSSKPPAPPSIISAQKVDNPAVGVTGHIAAGVMNPKTEKK